MTLMLCLLASCLGAVTARADNEVVATIVEVSGALEVPEINAKSAIIIDVASGSIIYEKNAYEKRPMASTTKLMTTLLALEKGNLGDTVSITKEMIAYDEEGSTKLGLRLGDTITLHDLIVAMMLLSGNDAAQSTAVYLGGSIDGFASMMNERAAELGMLDTHFITPSGLDDPDHYSTAYDMALLGIACAQTPGFTDFTSMMRCQIYYGNPQSARWLNTHNNLVQGQYKGIKGCDGLKTGYTDAAGYCLVSHVKREGLEFVCVTMGSPDYFSDQRLLIDYALSTYVKVNVTPNLGKNDIVLIGGTAQEVGIEVGGMSEFYVPRDKVNGITKKVNLGKFEYAPVTMGQVVGSVQYLYGNSVLAEFPIQATDNVDCITTDWLSAYIRAIKYEMED